MLQYLCVFVFLPNPSLSLSLSLAAMATFGDFTGFGEFTPGFAHSLERLEDERQITLMLALVGAARAAWPLGKQVVQAVIRQMAGTTTVNIEEIIAQAHLQVQKELALSSGDSKKSAFAKWGDLRGRKLEPELAEAASPDGEQSQQQPQQQQPQQQRQQMPVQGQDGYVALQSGMYNIGQPPRLTDDQTDDDELTKGILASKAIGKGQLRTLQQGEDNTPDDWIYSTNKDPIELQNKTKDAKILQLETEMRRMQKTIDELQALKDPQPTPLRTNIDTPQTPQRTTADITTVKHDNVAKSSTILAGILQRPPKTPMTDSSSDCGATSVQTGGIFQVAMTGGNGGRDDDGGDDGDGNGVGVHGRSNGYIGKRSEFVIVKASNLTVPIFSGTNLANNPFLPFYKAMRRLIYAQGEDGEQLLLLLDVVEKLGKEAFTNEQFQELASRCPKTKEYNRALTSALLNYTTGVAKGMMEYGVSNGFDAWRRLYNHYLPLAEDLQQLLIHELYSLSPVNENNIDGLFNQVERIVELYTKYGRADDPISERWIKAAVMRNLPKQLTKDLAMQLRDVKTVDEVRNIVNIYLHDHQTGMPRGQTGPMLCMAEDGQENTVSTSTNANNTKDVAKEDAKDKDNQWDGNGDVNATTKGNGKGKKGAKGYGECWHCGEWGHPRRECPHINDPAKGKGSLAALKGKQGGGKAKGKHGKGWKGGKGKGKGKWGKGYNNNYNYRYPGKGVGKGLNELNDEWFNAWGDDSYGDYDYDYNYGDNWSNYGGSLGNVTMMLERGGTDEQIKEHNGRETKTTGEHDPLLNTRRARPTTTYNRYEILTNYDDDDHDSEESDTDEQLTNKTNKHRPNKRQRLRRRQTTTTTDEDIRDAVAVNAVAESDWFGLSDASIIEDSAGLFPRHSAEDGRMRGRNAGLSHLIQLWCPSDGHRVCSGTCHNSGFWPRGGGSQKQPEGPLMRMMQRIGLQHQMPKPPWRRVKHLPDGNSTQNSTHNHTHDHSQLTTTFTTHTHNYTHNHTHEHSQLTTPLTTYTHEHSQLTTPPTTTHTINSHNSNHNHNHADADAAQQTFHKCDDEYLDEEAIHNAENEKPEVHNFTNSQCNSQQQQPSLQLHNNVAQVGSTSIRMNYNLHASSHDNYCTTGDLQSSEDSRVDLLSVKHRPSSQSRCVNWSNSSVSQLIGSNTALVSMAQTCKSEEGEAAMGWNPYSEEPSTAKLPCIHDGRSQPRDATDYASYMPTYSIYPQHNQATTGQLAANFGTSPQCSWAGARGKEGLESPGCEVSHSKA